MIRARHAFPGAVALAACGLLACVPKTTMVSTWSAPGFKKESVKKVLVLGIARDGAVRRSYEEDFSGRLKALGYDAIAGYTWVPDATAMDHAAVASRIKAEGVSHVLVTRLVARKQVQSYVPPQTVAVGAAPYGPGWYGGWYSYYSVGYTYVAQPGYITTDEVVTLETNFYDASKPEDQALVWTGTSETWTEDSPQSNVASVISAVVYRMRADRVL